MFNEQTDIWLEYFRKNRKYFEAAGEVLNTLSTLSMKNTPVTSALATVNITGKVIDTIFKQTTPWDVTENYTRISSITGQWVCEELFGLPIHKTIVGKDGSYTAVQWMFNDKPLIAIFDHMKCLYGPYIKDQSTLVDLQDTFSKTIWKDKNELGLSFARGPDGSSKFQFSSLPSLGNVIGSHDPSTYVDILKKYPPGPRTCLLVGPTGTGKTAIARQISQHLKPNASRILKIDSQILRRLDGMELLSLIQYIKPTVLLLDDVSLDNPEDTERLLATLEALRDPDTLVIITMMLSPTDNKKRTNAGSWHFPGMRPGRIDAIWYIDLPDEKDRVKIIQFYMNNKSLTLDKVTLNLIAKETKGLSGAYLSYLVDEFLIHGTSNWQDIVKKVKAFAPAPKASKTP